MVSDQGEGRHPPEADMLPDEREAILERAHDRADLYGEDYLSVDELAEELGFDPE